MSRTKHKRKPKDEHRMSVLHDHEFSPMARATKTKTRSEKRRKRDRWDRKGKHKGAWKDAA